MAETTSLTDELRILLKDNHPTLNKRSYTDLDLEIYLENALWDINVQPPAFTDFTIADYATNVPGWKPLILQGAMVFALISEGVFQARVEFNYQDNGISINTDRSGKLQSWVTSLMAAYQGKKEGMKKQYWFQATQRPRALLGSPLPFKMRSLSPRVWSYR